MPRKRTATVEETTTVTQRVTLTEEDHADTLPRDHLGRWTTRPTPTERWNAQRRQQVWRAAEVVVAAADPTQEFAPLRLMDRETLRQAVNILRALPGAAPLELTLGRST